MSFIYLAVLKYGDLICWLTCRYVNGTRACYTTLHRNHQFPLGMLGPVTILWDTPNIVKEASATATSHSSIPDQIGVTHQLAQPHTSAQNKQAIRKVLFIMHPALQVEAKIAIDHAAHHAFDYGHAIPRKEVKLNQFELTGSKSGRVLAQMLKPVAGTSLEKLAVSQTTFQNEFNSIQDIASF